MLIQEAAFACGTPCERRGVRTEHEVGGERIELCRLRGEHLVQPDRASVLWVGRASVHDNVGFRFSEGIVQPLQRVRPYHVV